MHVPQALALLVDWHKLQPLYEEHSVSVLSCALPLATKAVQVRPCCAVRMRIAAWPMHAGIPWRAKRLSQLPRLEPSAAEPANPPQSMSIALRMPAAPPIAATAAHSVFLRTYQPVCRPFGEPAPATRTESEAQLTEATHELARGKQLREDGQSEDALPLHDALADLSLSGEIHLDTADCKSEVGITSSKLDRLDDSLLYGEAGQQGEGRGQHRQAAAVFKPQPLQLRHLPGELGQAQPYGCNADAAGSAAVQDSMEGSRCACTPTLALCAHATAWVCLSRLL